MIDYQRYRHAMDNARATLSQAEAIQQRNDLGADDKNKLIAELTRKAGRLRRLAMSFCRNDKPARASTTDPAR